MTTRRHLKNTTALLIAGALTKLVQVTTAIVVIKRLSVSDHGVFQLAYSLGFIIALIGEAGLRGYALRELARRRDDAESARQLFGDILNVRLALTATVTPVAFLVLWITGYRENVLWATLYMATYALLDAFALLFKFVIRAYERMEFDALFSVIGRMAVLVLLLLMSGAHGTLTLTDALVAHAAGALIECTGLCVLLRLMLPVRFLNTVHLDSVWGIFIKSLPFAVVNVTSILYLRTGTLALSKLWDAEAVAYFNTAARLPEAALFVPVALVNAVVPFLARNADNRAMLEKYFDFLLRYILLTGCGAAAFFLFEPRFLILTLFKADYLAIQPALQLYGVWMAAAFVQYVTTNLLICLNEEKWVMHRYGMILGANIVLNLALVPWSGVTGAAWAMVLSQLAATALDIKRLHDRGVTMRMAPLMQAGGLIALLALLLAGEADLLRLAAASAAAMLWIGATAYWVDRELIRRIFRRRAGAEPPPPAPSDCT